MGILLPAILDKIEISKCGINLESWPDSIIGFGKMYPLNEPVMINQFCWNKKTPRKNGGGGISM